MTAAENFTDPIDSTTATPLGPPPGQLPPSPLAPPPARQAPPPASAAPPPDQVPYPTGPTAFGGIPIGAENPYDEGRPNFRFTAGEGTGGDRLKAVEAWAERVSPHLELVYLAYENIQRENAKSTELWTYVCKGADSQGVGGICNRQMKAKRPEFRTYAERLICPNPVHNGDLTPMEPILPQ